MPIQSQKSESDFLAESFKVLRARKALIIVLTSLVFLTTLGVSLVLPKWFLSKTTIRVEKPEGQVKLFQAQTTSFYDPNFIQEQFQIIQSERILYPVIENLGLNQIFGNQLNEGVPLRTSQSFRYLRRNMLQVRSVRSTSLIDIQVFARDPELAADIANEIARVYSANRIEFAVSGQEEGLQKLREELIEQERIVAAQRDAVDELRGDLNIAGVDLNRSVSDMEIENLRQLQRNLIALRVEAIGRKTRWERFREIPVEQRFGLVNSELIQDTNIQNLMQAYMVAEQNLVRLGGRLGEAHPDLVAAHGNLQKIESQLHGLLAGYEHSLEISWREAQARVAELERQLDQARVDQILTARDKMRPFEEAVERLRDEENIYRTMKLTLRQREIDFQVPKRTIEILNQAEAENNPAKPNLYLNSVLAILAGLVLGVGTSFLVEYFDTSFRSMEDIEEKMRAPIVGVIPRVVEGVDMEDFHTASAEPYRVLQANLELLRRKASAKLLAVQSAGPGEGKSTTLFHLSVAMAAAGDKVLVLDTDLRRPTQHRLHRVPPDRGLADYLRGRCSAGDVIRHAGVANLDFVTAGASDRFSLNLLHSKRLESMIADLSSRYDRIFLDSPPLIGVSDASFLASMADGVLLVMQHRRYPQSMVLRARHILDNLDAELMGIVLNRVPEGGDADYNYYTQNYDYYRSDDSSGKTPKAAKENEQEVVSLDRRV